jgi:hypothetical protein
MGRHIRPSDMQEVEATKAVVDKLVELGLLDGAKLDQLGTDSADVDTILAEANEGLELLDFAVETETSFKDLIERTLRKKLRNDALIKAIKEEEAALKRRRQVLEARNSKFADLIGWVLIQSKLPFIETIFGKVSPKRVPFNIEITKEAEPFIPAPFWVPQDDKLDAVAVKKYMKDRYDALAKAALIEDEIDREIARKQAEKEYPDIPHIKVIDDQMTFQVR